MTDLTKAPLDQLLSAVGKLRKSKQTAPPRKPVFRECAFCGQSFAARVMRQHQPGCRKAITAAVQGLRLAEPRPTPSLAENVARIHRFRGTGWKRNL